MNESGEGMIFFSLKHVQSASASALLAYTVAKGVMSRASNSLLSLIEMESPYCTKISTSTDSRSMDLDLIVHFLVRVFRV